MNTKLNQTSIKADAEVPLIHIRRDFHASPEQLMRCHLERELFARWIGPASLSTRIDYWDARTGGSWRYVASRDGEEFAFHGCFHTVGPTKIVQTFTWEGQPDDVALETVEFTDLGNGMTRLHARSLSESFAVRDSWMSSGMETGVNEGYAELERLLSNGIS
ncbi:MAG: SRPBCC domain-containing protein [Actinomycetota bacterium]|nr:SRPBCC domain-containing protein [Actinomycetota bacterium]